MKLSKFFKKAIVTSALVAAFSIFGIAGLPNQAKADTLPAQLYYSQRVLDSRSGTSHLEGYISIQNLAFEKNVTVHYTYDGGKTWYDAPASYLKTDLNDNSEVWKFQTMSVYYLQPITYCIKYEVNGQTYWDNNNGKNYTDGAFGKSYVYAQSINAETYNGSNYISFYTATRNIPGSNSKVVKVRYTEDNWNTYKDVDTAYPVGSASTADTTEWSTNVTVSSSAKQVKFAVLYEVDGVQYWDNNFGSNYTVNF